MHHLRLTRFRCCSAYTDFHVFIDRHYHAPLVYLAASVGSGGVGDHVRRGPKNNDHASEHPAVLYAKVRRVDPHSFECFACCDVPRNCRPDPCLCPGPRHISAVLEEINSNFDGMFDFFYLPQNKDMRKEGNPGFAFINFREYMTVVDFVAEFSGRRWNLDRKKVALRARCVAHAVTLSPPHPLIATFTCTYTFTSTHIYVYGN